MASMSCGPLTSENKKFSNAQDVNIFSGSNVSFYNILSHVLDSDSKILKIIFFFFSKISPVVEI